ncbi:MAG: GtrA family protein [Bacteroidaceae bacterium]|nr:GtrA family protein [Bacteroidaceae bacterium]
MGKIKEFITGKRQQIVQFIRFCIVGTVAAGIHYGIYYVLLRVGAGHNLAYATGYIISFVCNFIATSYFTFRSSPSWGRFAGFAGSHAVNFLLHMTLLNVFLWIGMHELIAPIAVMLVAMLVQYAILNLVFRKK